LVWKRSKTCHIKYRINLRIISSFLKGS
jgi:hypothetical protein